MSQDNNKNLEQENLDDSGAMQDLKQPRRWRALASKRVIYPVIYLGASVLIIALMYERNAIWGAKPTSQPVGAGQTSGQPHEAGSPSSDAVATNATDKFIWPVAPSEAANAHVTMGYFDKSAAASSQASALVDYNNTFYPHLGYDIALTSGKTFDVVAAAAGKVTKVEHSQLTGVSVTIDGADGYQTVYESLDSADVKNGDVVRQGQIVGASGFESYEPKAKNHLYFEVRKDNAPVDPGTLLPRK